MSIPETQSRRAPSRGSHEPIGRGRLTPLWVIGAFLTLTQIVVSVGVINTDGIVRIILAVFSTIFPLFVAACFFYILISRPQVFYAPSDLRPDLDFLAFVQALNFAKHQAKSRSHAIEHVEHDLQSALVKNDNVDEILKVIDLPADNLGNDKIAARKQALLLLLQNITRKTAKEVVEKSGLFVDTRPLLGEIGGDELYFEFSTFVTVQHLLDWLWAILHNASDARIDPWTYGKSWILQDADTQKRFSEIGSTGNTPDEHWVQPDKRALRDVGIYPGTRLLVRKP